MLRISRITRVMKWLFSGLFCFIVIGYLLPTKTPLIPVLYATSDDWDHQTFWYYPWGKSIVHKGIDIFSSEKTPVIAPDDGILMWTAEVPTGGKVSYLLSSKWRIHYFAHLHQHIAKPFSYLHQGDVIGLVGTTGNAKNRPPHLHYSIFSPIPHFWKIDDERQGWKKMFYLNPQEYLLGERAGF